MGILIGIFKFCWMLWFNLWNKCFIFTKDLRDCYSCLPGTNSTVNLSFLNVFVIILLELVLNIQGNGNILMETVIIHSNSAEEITKN